MQISVDFLTILSEAAVLAKQNKIVFANTSAQLVLGNDCVGKTLRSVFGSVLAGCQARTFLCDVSIDSKAYIARTIKADGMQAIFFAPRELPYSLLNDAFIYSMRVSMMNYGVAADIARAHAVQTGNKEMLAKIAPITQSYYRARRSISNIDIIRSHIENTLFFCARNIDLREMLSTMTDTVNTIDSNIKISLSADAPVHITADPQLIEQMMLNLISNCQLHAHGLSRISISLQETLDSVVISVDDDGCGIAPELLHQVFERYRYGVELSNIGSGAGLGLTVVQIVAKLHGGTMLFESRKDTGTTVRITISRALHPGVGAPVENFCADSHIPILIGLADCLDAACYMNKSN